jgi:hypothetical protein
MEHKNHIQDDGNKYNWVYQISTLLSLQHIKWSLFRTDTYKYSIKNVNLPEFTDRIFIEYDPTIKNEVSLFLNKGDIKWQSSEIEGSIKLKLYSILSAQLSKFVGILKVEYNEELILGLKLNYSEIDIVNAPKEVVTKLERLCK